jgi:hydrogenase nickel incorporation protein HypA/HybF
MPVGVPMHEMAITHSIVAICAEHAAGRRIVSVTLEIGDLAGVVPESVEFCFEACIRDTPLEGAELIIQRVPAAARCPACGGEAAVRACFDPCPACGRYGLDLIAGKELRVKELEVE